MNAESHKHVLLGVKEEIHDLEAQLEKLRGIVKYLEGKITNADPVVPHGERDKNEDPNSVIGKTRHGAAEIILRERGEWMTLPTIVNELQHCGYEPATERRRLSNTIYTAMDRKSDIFIKSGNEWGLTEWPQEDDEPDNPND